MSIHLPSHLSRLNNRYLEECQMKEGFHAPVHLGQEKTYSQQASLLALSLSNECSEY